MPPAAAAPLAAGAAAGGTAAAAGTAAAVGTAAAGAGAGAGLAGLATGAQIASGLATAGAGLATIFGGAPPGQKIQLPPELEEKQLEVFANFLNEAQANIDQTKELIPFIKERVQMLDTLAQQATPDPATIKRLQDLDATLAERFGVEVAKDVQAGIITEEAKRQSIELQNQIAAELTAQGKNVDDQILTDIQSAIRQRLDPSSPEAAAITEVRNALLEQVRAEGDVLQRDPRVEAELEKSKNQLMQDLANRGIDPNSTAGRRALQEFAQGATETRFTTSEQLKTGRISRLAQATQSVLGTTDAADLARSRALEQALGTQALASGRLSRLQQLGATINAPVQSAILAGEPERLRRAEELQRANLALGASAQAQSAFTGALGTQANLVQLQQLPLNIQSKILETRGAELGAFQSLGAQKLSSNTQALLQEGSIPGFKTRTVPRRLPTPGYGPGVQGPTFSPSQTFRIGPDGKIIPV